MLEFLKITKMNIEAHSPLQPEIKIELRVLENEKQGLSKMYKQDVWVSGVLIPMVTFRATEGTF